MPLSLTEIRARAIRFATEYRDAASERADAQGFWKDFFAVFGVSARRVGAFERPVTAPFRTSGHGRIDYLWKGVVLVEHKSLGQNLDRAAGQARDYFAGLRESEQPRYVIVSDFARIRLYDLDLNADPMEFALCDLPQNLDLFGFISGYATRHYGTLDAVDQNASETLGALHDRLVDDGYSGRKLDVWMVRLLFCLFADQSGIFQTGIFRELVESRTADDGSDLGAWIARLFRVLATPDTDRQSSLDPQLAAFPYVNGQLFDEQIDPPETNTAMREALLICTKVDWSRVSPAIFGSLFQSIKGKAARRSGGEHYTTEANILKCLDPLFLDRLRQELAAARVTNRKLDEFIKSLRRIRVFDPACGCGNFLVVAYREIRKLELEALRYRYGHDDAAELVSTVLSVVNVDQMFGIEIDDWPAQIARVALWLTDHQMNMALSTEFGLLRTRLPLRTAPNIRVGNALHINWRDLIRPSAGTYCVGNPPFVGAKQMSQAQRGDVALVFHNTSNAGLLDYVACWYHRAAEWMQQGQQATCCFVSTNSITQGEQPAVLWTNLWRYRVVINFAHRTFRWTSESRGKAAVHCVILGISLEDKSPKFLFDYEGTPDQPRMIEAKQINPYLADAPQLALRRRKTPISDAPLIGIGNKPIDGGFYLFTPQEKRQFLETEPGATRYFRRWMGAEEFLNGIERWFLWLGDVEPAHLRQMGQVRARIDEVRRFRLGEIPGKNGRRARDAATAKLARTPTRLHVENIPESEYLAIPGVSSETREYIPVAFLPSNVMASNLLNILPSANHYHFGILTSHMHMAWTRAVCGRLKSDFRYSIDIVYNNFPWPNSTDRQRAAIEAEAAKVLAARAEHPGATLADLYDPLAMPANLRKAHDSLDRAVDRAYGQTSGFPTDAARLAFLFQRHETLAAPLARPLPRRQPRRPRV